MAVSKIFHVALQKARTLWTGIPGQLKLGNSPQAPCSHDSWGWNISGPSPQASFESQMTEAIWSEIAHDMQALLQIEDEEERLQAVQEKVQEVSTKILESIRDKIFAKDSKGDLERADIVDQERLINELKKVLPLDLIAVQILEKAGVRISDILPKTSIEDFSKSLPESPNSDQNFEDRWIRASDELIDKFLYGQGNFSEEIDSQVDKMRINLEYKSVWMGNKVRQTSKHVVAQEKAIRQKLVELGERHSVSRHYLKKICSSREITTMIIARIRDSGKVLSAEELRDWVIRALQSRKDSPKGIEEICREIKGDLNFLKLLQNLIYAVNGFRMSVYGLSKFAGTPGFHNSRKVYEEFAKVLPEESNKNKIPYWEYGDKEFGEMAKSRGESLKEVSDQPQAFEKNLEDVKNEIRFLLRTIPHFSLEAYFQGLRESGLFLTGGGEELSAINKLSELAEQFKTTKRVSLDFLQDLIEKDFASWVLGPERLAQIWNEKASQLYCDHYVQTDGSYPNDQEAARLDVRASEETVRSVAEENGESSRGVEVAVEKFKEKAKERGLEEALNEIYRRIDLYFREFAEDLMRSSQLTAAFIQDETLHASKDRQEKAKGKRRNSKMEKLALKTTENKEIEQNRRNLQFIRKNRRMNRQERQS